jgi:hypothetical protein
MTAEKLPSKFWNKVDKGDDCWIWQGAKTPIGYGQISINGERDYVHRLAWAEANQRSIDKQINHHCDNPACVRPEHLYEGTQADNRQDAVKRGRLNVTGENAPQAKLTKSQVKEIRRKYDTDKASQYELEEDYPVTRSTIRKIVNRKIWRQL